MKLEVIKTIIELSSVPDEVTVTQSYKKYHLTNDGWFIETIDTYFNYGNWEAITEIRKANKKEVKELNNHTYKV